MARCADMRRREGLFDELLQERVALHTQGFAQEFWDRYQALVRKRRDESLVPAEQEELIRLSDEIEAADVRRLQHLMELARLRNIPLPALMEELDLPAPRHV